jgi:hypothetical protein
MAKNKKEYDVFKGILNGEQVNTLDSQTTRSCLAQKTINEIGDSTNVFVLHDPCDIRKPYSSDLEHLGDVMSLQKQVVPGYSSFNSVAITPDSQSVHLLDSVIYSNKQPTFVNQDTCHRIQKEQKNTTKSVELKDKKGNIITQEQIELVTTDEYQNGTKIAQNQIRKCSTLLKESNPERSICHILDREFDDNDVFEEINKLKDKLIIRLKLNRLSNELQQVYTPKGNLSKKKSYKKLVDKKFSNSETFIIEKLKIKGTLHVNVTCLIEFEKIILDKNTYFVVRISLSNHGKPLFDHPMLLITNQTITTAIEAQQIYKTYILRFKIELVFRFLKSHLGWPGRRGAARAVRRRFKYAISIAYVTFYL